MENRDNTTKNDQDIRQSDGTTSQQSEQITIKFGKGLAREFTGKDGKQYTSISIPNRDPADKSPWAYFVVPSDRVHENKFGNGLYVKLFADAHTTVTKAERIGQRDDGKGIYENKRFSIRNTDLKARVEECRFRRICTQPCSASQPTRSCCASRCSRRAACRSLYSTHIDDFEVSF